MEILVKRIAYKDTYTIGKMYIDGEYFCDTLEDKCRPVKIKGQTAIPPGNYNMRLTESNRFHRVLPEILNVPGFTGVRIHRGNTCEDTEGCILIGENKVKGEVINSAFTEKKLISKLNEYKGLDYTIKIE